MALINKIDQIDRWATVLFIYLIPWQARIIFSQGYLAGAPSEPQTRSLFLLEILLWLLVALRIGRIAKNGNYKKYFTKLSGRDRIFFTLAVLVFVSFFSVIISVDRSATLIASVHLLDGLAVLFLIITTISFHELRLAFLIAALVQTAIAFFQVLFQQVYPSAWLGVAAHFPGVAGTSVVEAGEQRFLRAYGTLPHPNILGGMLTIAILSSRAIFRRFSIFSFASFVMLAAGLFFTFSRLAWLALGVGLFAQWLWARRDKLFIKNVVTVIGTMLVLSALFAPLVLARATATGRLETKSITTRVASIKDALTIIRHDSLTGVGAGAFTAAVKEQIDADRNGYELEPPHSVFVAVFAELGVFGLLLFVWLICLLAVSAWRCGKIGMAAGLITLALFDHWAWTTYAGILIFWVGWGLTMRNNCDQGVTYKSGALVLSHDDPNKLLLLYRSGSEYCDWTFPKGHMESGESREDTMYREVMEETGLQVELIRPLPDRKYTTKRGHSAVVHFFLTRSLDDSKLRLEPGFPDNRFEWVRLDDAGEILTFDNMKEYYRSIKGLLRLS